MPGYIPASNIPMKDSKNGISNKAAKPHIKKPTPTAWEMEKLSPNEYPIDMQITDAKNKLMITEPQSRKQSCTYIETNGTVPCESRDGKIIT